MSASQSPHAKKSTMPPETIFAVQAFVNREGGLHVGFTGSAPSAEAAPAEASRLAERYAGTVAVAVVRDPSTKDIRFTVLSQVGEVPNDWAAPMKPTTPNE